LPGRARSLDQRQARFLAAVNKPRSMCICLLSGAADTNGRRYRARQYGRGTGAPLLRQHGCYFSMKDRRETPSAFPMRKPPESFQMYEETSQTVALQQGLRARSGIDSAMLAAAGVQRHARAILRQIWILQVVRARYGPEPAVAVGLGRGLCQCIDQLQNPCHPANARIQAFFGLCNCVRRTSSPWLVRSEAIEIGVNRLAEGLVVEKPRDQKWKPAGFRHGALQSAVCHCGRRPQKERSVYVTSSRRRSNDPGRPPHPVPSTQVGIDPDIDRTHGTHQNAPNHREGAASRTDASMASVLDKALRVIPDTTPILLRCHEEMLACHRDLRRAVPGAEGTERSAEFVGRAAQADKSCCLWSGCLSPLSPVKSRRSQELTEA